MNVKLEILTECFQHQHSPYDFDQGYKSEHGDAVKIDH